MREGGEGGAGGYRVLLHESQSVSAEGDMTLVLALKMNHLCMPKHGLRSNIERDVANYVVCVM